MVVNLTPDKQQPDVSARRSTATDEKRRRWVLRAVSTWWKMGERIRQRYFTVMMVAPKCQRTEVREEYEHGLGVPTLIPITRKTMQRRRVWQSLKHGRRQPVVTVRACWR
ncbi:hypothetical protein ACNKHL_23050 [Shigella flexneri]